MDFLLPELGEGIDSATVVSVKVKVGDTVSAGQDVIDLETDKAAVSVPIETAGKVTEVKVKPGDKVPVGGLLFVIESAGTSATPAPVEKPAPTASAPPSTPTSPPVPSGNGTGSSTVEFALPELGEGIDSATVVGLKVEVGAKVSEGQDFIDVETDKAAVTVPIAISGTVLEVLVKPGDKLAVGTLIAKIQSTSSNPAAVSPPAAPIAKSTNSSKEVPVAAKAPAAVAVLPPTKKDLTPAGPATRRLARELGVALLEVKPTGRGGRVTIDDVKGFVKAERQTGKQSGGTISGSIVNAFTLPALPDFSKFGQIEKKPVAKIRETIAKNLTIAWRTMPMVTQNDLADITDLEAGRKRIVENVPKGSPKITWTVLAVKACVAALKEFPNFNASYDMNSGELILKKYFHIGIAVDTERGLVVPVIRDADKKSIRDIASEVQSLAEKARSAKLGIDEMRGGSFTITNLGGIGGTSFTPIVNYPEVAILGMCRSSLQPVVKDGQIVSRLMLPLSLTYDHRVVDGADGARFTSRLVQLFSDPMRLLMES